MQKIVEQLIQANATKTIKTAGLEDLVHRHLGQGFIDQGGYVAFARVIEELCRRGQLLPVKSAGCNGRNPQLFNHYRKQLAVLDPVIKLNLLSLDTRIRVDKYLANPGQYQKDQAYLTALDRFFKDPGLSETLQVPYAINERSFQIFGDEKFLASNSGRAFLQQIGLTYANLSCYTTPEPFFYVDYRQPGEKQTSCLVIENKDTFYTLRKCLATGRCQINRQPINLLVYGEGRKIVSSFAFMAEVTGPDPAAVTVYYFGDLDPEGIDIFGSLTERYPDYNIHPFIYLYQQLLERQGERAPVRRDKQQRLQPKHLEGFLQNFAPAVARQIVELFQNNRYLPQEGLAYSFFAEEVGLVEKHPDRI